MGEVRTFTLEVKLKKLSLNVELAFDSVSICFKSTWSMHKLDLFCLFLGSWRCIAWVWRREWKWLHPGFALSAVEWMLQHKGYHVILVVFSDFAFMLTSSDKFSYYAVCFSRAKEN